MPPKASKTSVPALILPYARATTWTSAPAHVNPTNTWFQNVVAVYLTARDYLENVELARGRVYDRDAWLTALLSRHSRVDYLYHLAALNHAAINIEVSPTYEERFLSQLDPAVSRLIRGLLTPDERSLPRRFLARQMVLRAMRLVLVSSSDDGSADPDSSLVADLEKISPDVAAVFLVHLAGDAPAPENPDNAEFLGFPEPLAREIIANNLFNEPVDEGGLLGRSQLLWSAYGSRLTKYPLRRLPTELLYEAAGLTFDDLLTLGLSVYAYANRYDSGHLIALDISISHDLNIEPVVIEKFLGLFSSTPTDLARNLTGCPEPWQMWPIQERPLLRDDQNILVLDELYLAERVTQGLYWLVHDYEKRNHGEKSRIRWTQAYGEMIETRVEEQIYRMAPSLLGGGKAFFTEEVLQTAFPGRKNADIIVDYGEEVILAEVVSGTVKRKTRELGELESFRSGDTEKIVLKKVRQLATTAENLLQEPQPTASPLLATPRRIFPIVICSGQYPVNPLSIRYINSRVRHEGLMQDGRIETLGIIDLPTLDICESICSSKGVTFLDLIRDWKLSSSYSELSLYSYLVSRFGGEETIRPTDMRDAIGKSFRIIRDRYKKGGA